MWEKEGSFLYHILAELYMTIQFFAHNIVKLFYEFYTLN